MKTEIPQHVSPERAARIGVLFLGICGVAGLTLFGAETAPAESKAEKKPAAEEKASEEPKEYRNWFDVSVGGVFVDGDKAQFKRRQQTPRDAFGGVESFHYEQDVGKKGLLKIDGRGLFDNHDYSLKFALEHPDIGYLRAGYKESRTWYDGSGGFFPQNGQWLSLFNEELALDRGEAWFEGGLTLPGKPVLTFEYRHQFRDGRKDSTSWGVSNQTGGVGTRNIVPAFYELDENRDIFAGDIKHTIGKTDLGLGLRYELVNNNNSRKMRLTPGETKAGNSIDRYLTHREGFESDSFSAHAFTETRFNEKVLLTTGYSFTTLDTDLSGSRFYGPGYDLMYDPVSVINPDRRLFDDKGFLGLSGGSEMKLYIMNLNLMMVPWDHFSLVPSVRVEKRDVESVSAFMDTDIFANEWHLAASDRGLVDVAERLEARYTGITNWVLYARGDWIEGNGDLRETEYNFAVAPDPLLLDRVTDEERFTQKYTAGVNWYPHKRLNLAAQYYHKIRENDYDHRRNINQYLLAGFYPGFITAQDFEMDDLNLRVTWRPLNNLTLVSRYDYQLSAVDTATTTLVNGQSAEMTSHIFGETITWSPLSRLYLQGSINYVWDETDTPVEAITIAPGSLLDSQNDYWNASLMTGYALNDKTELQAQYFYYRADNFVNNSAAGQPFGAAAEERGITVAMTRQIKANIQWTLKYGFFSNRDATSGGNNDYDAHLVYSNVRYLF